MVSAAPSAPQSPVVVTGLGLATSLGFGVARTWERLLAGESAIAEQPLERFALPIPLPVRMGAEVPRGALGEEIRRAVPRGVWNTSAPVCHLWLLAALEALAAAGLPPRAGKGEAREGDVPQGDRANDGASARTGVFVGSGGGAHGFAEEEYIRVYTAEKPSQRDVSRFAIPMYMSSSLAGQLSILAGLRGPAQVFNTACSSGATALLAALDALRAGRVDRAVAGGVDLTLSAATLKGFYNIGALARGKRGPGACRPFDAERDGLVLGEGAGCLVLERADAAAARGARARAVLLGGASNAEAHHLLAPREDGVGMAECMALALADAGVGPEGVAHVYAHGTGTRFNDRCEAAALSRLFPHRPTVSASKELLGHTLGAAGAIDAALAVLGLESGRVVPLRHLDTADPDCPVNPARAAIHPRLGNAAGVPPDGSAPEPVVLVNAFAFGGHNVSLVFGAPTRPAPQEHP